MTIHTVLDWDYNADTLRRMVRDGADINAHAGAARETALHVAARRRRREAVGLLLGWGAEKDAVNAYGKTPYAHAVRRGFDDITEVLIIHGAHTDLNAADRLAVAITRGHLDEARRLLAYAPGLARTGNPGEDRLLADVAGRASTVPAVTLLIEAGADLAAPGLDGGTPLHQAAWFGQPANARVLIAAGAPVNVFDPVHASSPLGWAVHGSRHSGGAAERQGQYVALVRMLLDAGSVLHYPGAPQDESFLHRLLSEASAQVRELLQPGDSS